MNLPTTKLSKEELKAIALEKFKANELIHSLVVKIISWRTGLVEGTMISDTNKVTNREWNTYRKHLLLISKIEGVVKVKIKLKETFQKIKDRGGFE